jgi:hypothetical protein
VILAGVAIVVTAVSAMIPKITELRENARELRADESTRSQRHFYDLSQVVEQAARSGTAAGIKKGQASAEELSKLAGSFSYDTEYGNAVHYYHLVLGRLALQSGDVEGAKSQLLQAGKAPSSPQLAAFGPDMTLAQELLQRGETAAVLAYLSECEELWLAKPNPLAEWEATIRSAAIPDFGRHSGLPKAGA